MNLLSLNPFFYDEYLFTDYLISSITDMCQRLAEKERGFISVQLESRHLCFQAIDGRSPTYVRGLGVVGRFPIFVEGSLASNLPN